LKEQGANTDKACALGDEIGTSLKPLRKAKVFVFI